MSLHKDGADETWPTVVAADWQEAVALAGIGGGGIDFVCEDGNRISFGPTIRLAGAPVANVEPVADMILKAAANAG